MNTINSDEITRIKSYLHKTGLFYSGADNFEYEVITDRPDKIKYMITIDNHKYVLDILKNNKENENIVSGMAVQRYLSNQDMAAIPFYIEPTGEFTLTEYLDNYESLDNIDIKDQNVEEILTQFTEIEKALHSQESPSNESLFNNLKNGKFIENLNGFIKDGLLNVDEANSVVNYINNNYSVFSEPIVMKHSDIQPGNILYNKETGKVKLIDFEFAGYGGSMYDWACFYSTMPTEYISKMDEDILKNPMFKFFVFDFNLRRVSYLTKDINELKSKVDIKDEKSVKEFEEKYKELKTRYLKAKDTYKKVIDEIKKETVKIKV